MDAYLALSKYTIRTLGKHKVCSDNNYTYPPPPFTTLPPTSRSTGFKAFQPLGKPYAYVFTSKDSYLLNLRFVASLGTRAGNCPLREFCALT